jgi:hypothetical protein
MVCPSGGESELASDSEMEARYRLVEMLDKEMGPSESVVAEYTKGGLVLQVIGDNRNASAFVITFGLWKSESAEKLLASGKAESEMRRVAQRGLR